MAFGMDWDWMIGKREKGGELYVLMSCIGEPRECRK